MGQKLVIAEKPMLARDIARAICGKEVSESARLPISGNGYTVIACAGHLLELVEPDAVNPAWGKPWSLDVLPIQIDDWAKEPTEDKGSLYRHLWMDSSVAASSSSCAIDRTASQRSMAFFTSALSCQPCAVNTTAALQESAHFFKQLQRLVGLQSKSSNPSTTITVDFPRPELSTYANSLITFSSSTTVDGISRSFISNLERSSKAVRISSLTTSALECNRRAV